MALAYRPTANAERIEPKPFRPALQLAPVNGWGLFRLPVAVGILEQAMLVTKWGSLQDTFVMDAATHPLEKFPIWSR
jgi:hypothetical protein